MNDPFEDSLRRLAIFMSFSNLADRIERLSEYDQELVLFEADILLSERDMKLRRRLPSDKKALNQVIADNNGISIEMLINSPNYITLCKEYIDNESIKTLTETLEIFEKLNERLKILGIDLEFKREEVKMMLCLRPI